MLSPRHAELTAALIDTLEGGGAPLTHEWLTEHKVNMDEGLAISRMVAYILQEFMGQTNQEQLQRITAGATAFVEMEEQR